MRHLLLALLLWGACPLPLPQAAANGHAQADLFKLLRRKGACPAHRGKRQRPRNRPLFTPTWLRDEGSVRQARKLEYQRQARRRQRAKQAREVKSKFR